MRNAWLFLFLAGCPKPAPTVTEEPQWLTSEPDVVEIPVPVETGEWRGDGVSVWVAPGWAGGHTQGPPEVLAIEDSETGTKLTVELGPTEFGLPRGCEVLFEDAGTYRTVPLEELQTTSCVEEDGTLVQVWLGRAEFVAVRLTVRYPMGSAVLGRQRVEAVLSTISAAAGG